MRAYQCFWNGKKAIVAAWDEPHYGDQDTRLSHVHNQIEKIKEFLAQATKCNTPKDVGAMITAGLDMFHDFEVFDWENPGTPAVGIAEFWGYDASQGFEKITLSTSIGQFLMTIIRIGNPKR